MMLRRLPLAEALKALPPEWPQDPIPAIRQAIARSGRKVVVLDDDPTGAQTVYGVPVLTRWDVDSLADELAGESSTFYVLTNSRGLAPSAAVALNAEIGRHLLEAARKAGRPFTVVSRSDSTLRGHFPGEVEALANALGDGFDAWVLVPFFLEGGRYTMDNVHYVAEGDWLVPAGETEFARDPAFGYRASDLRLWVQEKTGGRVRAQDVACVSLEDIRRGGPERVAGRLLGLPPGSVCIVNAASYRDLEVFVLGLLDAEARGRRFLCRTAASFIRARMGLYGRPLLAWGELDIPAWGGALVVVGSHVPRTSGQLARLLERPGIEGIEVSVPALLSESRHAAEVRRVAQWAGEALEGGRDVVVYTSRQLVTGNNAEDSLSIGQRVSDGLIAIVQGIAARPRYMLAKGGMTSSRIATEGLGVRRALVPGQVLPGVPVWRLGPESRYPGLAYVVFPGNVGGPDALAEVVDRLSARAGNG